MKTVPAFLLGAALVGSFAAVQPRVNRGVLRGAEELVDRKVVALSAEEPAFLLGPTRGVYLQGYGAVFTTEIDLMPGAATNPFRPQYNKQDIGRLRANKQFRLDILKHKIRDTLIATADSLQSVPLDERIALAVTIPYYPWEDSAGMPRQILMQATRRVLLQGSEGNTLAVESKATIQEF
jgi:hypothetical protein